MQAEPEADVCQPVQQFSAQFRLFSEIALDPGATAVDRRADRHCRATSVIRIRELEELRHERGDAFRLRRLVDRQIALCGGYTPATRCRPLRPAVHRVQRRLEPRLREVAAQPSPQRRPAWCALRRDGSAVAGMWLRDGDAGKAGRLIAHDARDRFERPVFEAIRSLTAQQLAQQDTQRVDVRGGAHHFAMDLLGRRILRR